MALLVDAEHLLDLRLGLQQEVLGAAAADDAARRSCRRCAWPRARSPRSRSRRRSRRSAAGCPPAPARPRSCRSSCRPASWCRSARRSSCAAASTERCGRPERLLALAHVAAEQVVVLGGAHRRAGTRAAPRPRGRRRRSRAARCSRRRCRRCAPRPCRAARRRRRSGVPWCSASPSAKWASW